MANHERKLQRASTTLRVSMHRNGLQCTVLAEIGQGSLAR